MSADEIIKRLKIGDVRTASSIISQIENESVNVKQLIKSIIPFTGNAHIIGVTGSPGVGKSTLIDELISNYRNNSKNVGVLAVDPTSPFTGGAILGDRVRMQHHTEDPMVFVRSLATRGELGGLSKAVGDAIHVMDVMGKEKILIETVGTGQQEVDIINNAHTVVVVLVPGMGDQIQSIKAGVIEIGDIFVINKADRTGAQELYKEMDNMLGLTNTCDSEWRAPIVPIENVSDKFKFTRDIEKLAKVCDAHYIHSKNSGLLVSRKRRKAVNQMNEALREVVLEPLLRKLTKSGDFERMIEKLLKKESDPYTLAEEVISNHKL